MPLIPTRVVSVHDVVSYAYSILCHSCVTYVVPYPAYIVSYCMSTYICDQILENLPSTNK